VLEDPAGRAELQRLGARSIPVLSRGDKFVFAQNIAQVVAFLKLDEKTGPVLSPAQLVERMTRFIDASLAIVPVTLAGVGIVPGAVIVAIAVVAVLAQVDLLRRIATHVAVRGAICLGLGALAIAAVVDLSGDMRALL